MTCEPRRVGTSHVRRVDGTPAAAALPGSANQPLAGLRVIDMSTSVVGIQASQHLADYGADVVFVEPPGGSPWRRHPSWPLWGRGKSSWEVNLHDAERLADVRAAICSSDILIETFRPSVAGRLGVGYESFEKDAPHLVYGSVTGFGPACRYSRVRGYEGTVAAVAGAMHSLRVLNPRPGPVFGSAWTCSAGATQLLLQGVLAALYERASSGLGQHVETSLVEALAAHELDSLMHLVLSRRYPDAFYAAPLISPEGVPNSGMVFRSLVAPTSDGRWLQFGHVTERLFRGLMVSLGLDWMFDSDEWKTAPDFDDVSVRVAFWEQMLTAVRQRSLAEWQDIFAQSQGWAEYYRTGNELLSHPQMVADHRVARAVSEDGESLTAPGLLVHLDQTPGRPSPVAPKLDERPEPLFDSPAWWTTDKTSATVSKPPLADITILELGVYFAGPLAATMLADLGARVIKVEPFEGDPVRHVSGLPEAGGTRVMQGKESIAVDMRTEAGRTLVLELAARADVVLQSFRGGAAHRLGVDSATLLAHNPNLVYVDAPGYGTSGPCSDKPAFAPTMGSASGFTMRNMGNVLPTSTDLDIDGVKALAPRLFAANTVLGNADAFAAQAVATAVLLGLIARQRGGTGQRIETSMLASMAHVMSDQMVSPANASGWYQDSDEALLGSGPLYRLYECREGWVFLAVTTDKEWEALRRVVAHPELDGLTLSEAQDMRAVEGILEHVFAGLSAHEWEHRMLAVDVACVVVTEAPIEEVLLDNIIATTGGYTTQVVHPTWEEHPRLKPLIRLSRSETVCAAGVLCGQHTDALLRELGYGQTAIEELRSQSIVA